IGVLHLLDGFLAPLLGERFVAPIVEQTIMQPILIDRGQLVPQRLVEIIDDTRLPSHNLLLVLAVIARSAFETLSIIAGVPHAESGCGAYQMTIVESVT